VEFCRQPGELAHFEGAKQQKGPVLAGPFPLIEAPRLGEPPLE
jgi:hypothetical protein